MSSPAETMERLREHEESRLFRIIQDHNLLINVNGANVIAIDPHGRKWQGADLREVLRQIK